MDKKLNTGSFEKLLKEKADEFRMYPSKRIWHSIYNDLHPGRRWPSVAMSIIMILTLLLVGYLNSDNSKNPTLQTAQNIPAVTRPVTEKKNIASARQLEIKYVNNNIAIAEINIKPTVSFNPKSTEVAKGFNNAKFNNVRPNTLPAITNTQPSQASEKSRSATLLLLKGQKQSNRIHTLQVILANTDQDNISLKKSLQPLNKNNVADLSDYDKEEGKEMLANEEKEQKEESTKNNKPSRKKINDKLGWQLYATPSIAYRKLSNNLIVDNEDYNGIPSVGTDEEINNSTRHAPLIGLEAGAAMQYAFSSFIKVKAGFQFNYSGYNISAFESSHPISTTLTLNDENSKMPYTVPRTSIYSNTYGTSPVTIHNKTYQLSVPFGLELKLAGNNTLQWNIGATLQPTFIMGENAYLLSSDRRNYVNDPSMINKWNLNAGFETFISYQTNGVTWQLGPQFRYQVYSTYGRQYTIAENLTNYGLKIGVSRVLQ